ncbi:hypothetical protein NQ176_g9073 [Zarea fungicola]|uniref:Uncharacterized protein n=1 Tax=Zarea fungicola TaxID=93591 RepID=A0ACC1MPQ6_9HYPO|nr:hypothetical protein NQ176_g9073 [Lecanicillium fungicola]
MPTPEYDLLSAQPIGLDRARSREAERSFLDDASKASATPPASMSALGPPKEVSCLPSADSGIFMSTINDDVVLKLGTAAQPTTLTQTIHTELLNDLQCNGAAKSALQAILGLDGANAPTFTRDAAELDDNASVTAASWISRTSTPDGEMDGEMDGGAQLGRSDTAFSAIDTHFARPAYPDTSKPVMTTVIDTPVTTLENHFLHKPNGSLTGLGTGHGIAAPLLADLNPDIHFDSALWPDATRRFMTGAKS